VGVMLSLASLSPPSLWLQAGLMLHFKKRVDSPTASFDGVQIVLVAVSLVVGSGYHFSVLQGSASCGDEAVSQLSSALVSRAYWQPTPVTGGVFSITDANNNRGLALSSDGSTIAVCNARTCKVTLYALDHDKKTATITSVFGGKGAAVGQFNFPTRVGFMPNGNLLVCEYTNCRLQELSLEGRVLRVTNLDCIGFGVHATKQVIVASQGGPDDKVHIYDNETGKLRVKFGLLGPAVGEFDGLHGITMSLDGNYVVLAEADNHRISWFKLPTEVGVVPTVEVLTGDDGCPLPFHRPLGMCFIDDKLLAVSNHGDNEIVIVIVDFETKTFCIDCRIGHSDDVRFYGPCALAWIASRKELLVLNQNSSNICVLRLD
jgi:WD40 repeat protein